jgi:tetratricopeptide (TPR) repeat protein
LRKKLLTEDHPDYAESLDHLGTLYQAMGHYRRALPLVEQARGLRKKLLGEDHPDYAQSLNNLGVLYHLIGDHRRALPLFQQVGKLRKQRQDRRTQAQPAWLVGRICPVRRWPVRPWR